MRRGMISVSRAIALSTLIHFLFMGGATAQVIVVGCDTATPSSSTSSVEGGTPTTVFEGDTTFVCDDETELDSSIHITPWQCDEVDFPSDLETLVSNCGPNKKSIEFSLRDVGALFEHESLENGKPSEVKFAVPNTGYIHIAGYSPETGYVDARVYCSEISGATPSAVGSLAGFEEMMLEGHFLVFEDGVSESLDKPVHLNCHWFLFFQ